MRHGDKINNLGRTASHRRALLANLAIALIEHKRITTTLAKARALRRYIEPLVTKAKDNTTHSRRVVFSYLQNKEAVSELFGNIAAKVGDRPGGYVRVIKLGFRRGDGAETALIELVDFNEVYKAGNSNGSESKKKTRRGRRKSSGTAPLVAAPAAVAAVVEEPVQEVVEEAAPVVEETLAPAVEAVAEETPAAEDTAAPAEEEKKDGE
jgi:large subunit ribosomal protein L17